MYLHNAQGEYVCEFCGCSSDEDCPEECGWLRLPDDQGGGPLVTDEATDNAEIPALAVQAAAKALADDVGLVDECGFDDAWRTRTAGFILAAILPDLPAHQIGDELAPELRQEIRTVMELGRALGKAEGRQEATEEIAEALKQRRDEAIRVGQSGWPLLTEAWVIARDTGKGDSL